MGRGKGQLEQLEEQLAELNQEIHECIAEREQIAQRARALQAKLRDGAEPEQRPGIRERLKDLQRNYDQVKLRESRLADKRSTLAPRVVARRKQVAGAEQTLATLEDPPPWFDETRREISPHTLRQLEQRARQVIRELMS